MRGAERAQVLGASCGREALVAAGPDEAAWLLLPEEPVGGDWDAFYEGGFEESDLEQVRAFTTGYREVIERALSAATAEVREVLDGVCVTGQGGEEVLDYGELLLAVSQELNGTLPSDRGYRFDWSRFSRERARRLLGQHRALVNALYEQACHGQGSVAL